MWGLKELLYLYTFFLVPPVIKGEDLQDLLVNAGNDISLPVDVEGFPTPSVTWTLNGKDLSASDRITFEERGGFTGVKIRKVMKSDAGTYKLSLSNAAGTAHSSFSLIVHCEYILCT